MRGFKAIIVGSVFIIVVMLFLQLLYIFAAVAYNALAKDYPVLHEVSGSLRYVIGIPIFVVTMFIGGYITASIANAETVVKVLLHCLVVGLITTGGMIYPTLEYSSITNTGIVILVLSLAATSSGGWYWYRGSRKS